MATSIYRNKNMRRPKKTPGKRRQRMKDQRRRLVELGIMDEAQAAKLSIKELRQKVIKAEQETARAQGKEQAGS